MLTQCPQCATLFPIDSEQLAAAHGRVRCGVCEAEFDALERLRQAPEELIEVPRLDPEFAARQGDLFAPPTPAEAQLPGFLAPVVQPIGNRWWWLAAASLALLLGFQIVLSQRHDWARQPQWRASYEPLCAVLGCDLPIWREPERWTLLSREVAPHPSVGDALLVTATLRNDARWPQPLPWLELALADIDGRPVALRRFSPGELLSGYDGRPLPSGQTADVRLEISDPGKAALAFAFEFR